LEDIAYSLLRLTELKAEVENNEARIREGGD